jgi:hypothetical protein
MTCRFGAIATGRHIAPAAPPIFRPIVENTGAPRVGASPHPWQFTENERIRRGFDDRNHQPSEGIADWNERPRIRAVAPTLDASRAGAAAEYAIDLA